MHEQVVVFDNAAMLPVYVVKMATADPAYPPHPMHHGPGAAVKEPLKGLEAQSGRRPSPYAAPAAYVAPAPAFADHHAYLVHLGGRGCGKKTRRAPAAHAPPPSASPQPGTPLTAAEAEAEAAAAEGSSSP